MFAGLITLALLYSTRLTIESAIPNVRSAISNARSANIDPIGNACGTGRMCRSIKKCVSRSNICNGMDDCGDNSDEERCPSPIGRRDRVPIDPIGNACGSGRMCRSIKKCVSRSNICNGVDDCGDNSDEERCPASVGRRDRVPIDPIGNACGSGRMCRSIKKCVSRSNICNGVDDCGDNSDEENCRIAQVPVGRRERPDPIGNACGSGRMCRSIKKCVSRLNICNGVDDCGDNSDEERCPASVGRRDRAPIDPIGNACGSGRMCRSIKKCVSRSNICNGVDDCGDNSDEENCRIAQVPLGFDAIGNACGSGRMCRSIKKCVSRSNICNGVDDCGDNSDEERCPSPIGRRERPDPIGNACGSGRMCRSIKKCVSRSNICNGVDDCGDNSDEENCRIAQVPVGFDAIGNACGSGRMCRSVKKCVSRANICNGVDDCGDNSDEQGCREVGR